jgi:DNA-binding transcriptional LysR family regulator
LDQFASIALFVAAVEEGSLVAAGRRFGLSSSMAGKHVKALEAELNASLIQRSTRRLNLTDVGRAYYERCKLILEDLDDANREATDSNVTIRGVLRISAPVTFGAMYMGDVVARYLADHPQSMTELQLSDQYLDLLSHGIDLAVRIGGIPSSGTMSKQVGSCGMIICAAPNFLERYGVPRTADDLRRIPKLTFHDAVSSGTWTITDITGRTHEIAEPFRMVANNAQMLHAAALEGAGVAFGPEFVFGASIAAGNLARLLPDFTTAELKIHAVYPAARHVSGKVHRFIDYLSSAFLEDPPWERVQ